MASTSCKRTVQATDPGFQKIVLRWYNEPVSEDAESNSDDSSHEADQPHIVIIIADDLGWNDVGFHGSDQIPTPNLDALAYNGIILNSHYVQPSCTASRAALLTGKYPVRYGLQGSSLSPAEPVSLPQGKLLPEYMKDLGYNTHLIGKWNLGYAHWNDTPIYRGFDYHFGFYNTHVSYYDYLTTWKINDKTYTGFDLRQNTQPAWEFAGKYATDVFTNHAINTIHSHDHNKPLFMVMSHLAVHSANPGKLLEAPQETIDKFKYITDSNRRTYAAMVSKLDESVGLIVEALETESMLQNSIILFFSDNGAPTIGSDLNWGSNYPLKGVKNTVFEGGIRSSSFIWSPLVVQNQRVSNELIHITDWLPTLYSAAGGDIALLDPALDGLDQWSSLVYDLASPRADMLININDVERTAGVRFHNWKLLLGVPISPAFDNHLGESGKNVIYELKYNVSAVAQSPAAKSLEKVSFSTATAEEYRVYRSLATIRCAHSKGQKNPCDLASGAVCLYDIPRDACEENNLAKYFPNVVRSMKRALIEYKSGSQSQINQKPDIEKDDPKLFQYTWNPWLDCADVTCTA
ncbi:hypothetical protein RN001_003498 [Aquatica leii]|uniref:Sulfatase N-terminal domain-containing protein n=1 Tax=Aquatica leii TaxID=1421715 RepID=A0AAN7Q9L4_9COLE|nr:hypothetical protein RN001_003498 [Aquatica leii]